MNMAGDNRRVTVFLQDLAGGGAERVMLLLAGGMAQKGVLVDLVLVRAQGPYLSSIPQGVRVIPLNCRRTLKSVWPLARYLERERPAALLSALVHVNIAAVLAARLARTATRVIVTEHNQISQNMAAGPKASVALAHRAVGWLYPWADRIVAVSEGVADDLSAFSGLARDRIDVIHNPIVTPQMLAMADQPPNHPWLTNRRADVILGVGRLNPQKDFATLLRAFALVRARRDARLIIIGEGGERAALEGLVAELGLADSVDMPGFVDNPYAFMKSCDLMVLSSRWEGLPTALVEAMACGTPVVATDCRSGPQEILKGGAYGELVPVGDAETLGAAMLRTLSEPRPGALLAERGADFTAERAVESYLDLALARKAVSP